MATLTAPEALAVRRALSRRWSSGETCNVTKADLTAAIPLIDQWLDDNFASFNAALPAGFAAAATTNQKAALLMYVLMKKRGATLPEE